MIRVELIMQHKLGQGWNDNESFLCYLLAVDCYEVLRDPENWTRHTRPQLDIQILITN